jgi:hypothetical protein
METNVMSKVNELIGILAVMLPMSLGILNIAEGHTLAGLGFANFAILVSINQAIINKKEKTDE